MMKTLTGSILLLCFSLALLGGSVWGMPIKDEQALATATDFNPLQAAQLAFPHHVYGSDVSQPHSQASFKCMKDMNLTFTIVRAFRSLGSPDPNAAQTVKNAWAGGQRYVDVYLFPCPKCGDPAGQVTAMVTNLRNAGAKYGMVWLDVEGTQYWLGTQAANRAFFNGLVAQAQRLNQNIGIYTSKSQWDPIMGNWNGGASFPLWYARYDGRPEFNDFVPFGGWNKPAMKQFSDAGRHCSASYDINWYPQ